MALTTFTPRYLVNFQCRGVLLLWLIVGQGPTELAVDAIGGYLSVVFSHLSFRTSFSLSLGDGRYMRSGVI